MKKITKMKNTMITLTIAVAMTIIASCSKSESETCTWGNSYLAGKTFFTSKVSGGTGSVNDSLGTFINYTFTSDSIKTETLYRTPNRTETVAYTATTISGVNYLTVNGAIKIENFTCSGFSFSSGGNEPFNITLSKK